MLRSFSNNTRGNIAMMTALLAPVLMMFAGAGVDFQRWHAQRATLKNVTDSLALRGAREFLLASADANQIESILTAAWDSGMAEQYGLGSAELDVSVDTQTFSVTVSLVQAPSKGLILTKVAPYKEDINVNSTATAQGGMNVCVIALDESASGALKASWSAKLTAEECSILSNSSSAYGIDVTGSSALTAGLICSAGGASGDGDYSPAATTDCPVYDDPLSSRQAPSYGGCDYNNTMLGERSIENFLMAVSASRAESEEEEEEESEDETAPAGYTTYTLDPGVYCGGIEVASNADVILNPGVYIIKDGPLTVDFGAWFRGDNVAFYMVGTDSKFSFGAESKISLSAPFDGGLAGILFFEDQNAPLGRTHSIRSNDARKLLGTFYLPRGTLSIASMQPVADQSAYTAMVVRKLVMTGSPTLVLNSDYAATNVPVPDGIGPVGGTTFLRD